MSFTFPHLFCENGENLGMNIASKSLKLDRIASCIGNCVRGGSRIAIVMLRKGNPDVCLGAVTFASGCQ